MHVHLDPVGGVAGDMFAAALLDAFPERADALAAELARSRLHEIVTVRSEPFTDGILRGQRFHTTPAPGGGQDHGSGHVHVPHHDHGTHPHPHPETPEEGGGRRVGAAGDHHSHEDGEGHREHPHDHGHPHRRFADIRAWLGESGLAGPVAERATAIFTVLAEAEAAVHGISVEDVTFHEVGAWDSIADIVCAAWLIDSLEPASWSSAPAPPRGRAGPHRARHAPGPRPGDGDSAAGLSDPPRRRGRGARHPDRGRDPSSSRACLRPNRDSRAGSRGPATASAAAGFPGMSNVLRALVLDPVREEGGGWREETIGVCSFEVDDQTAEDLAFGLDRLRAAEGVLDVVQTPAFGKKGRMAASVRVLARPGAREAVIARCFAETTTLGVRWQAIRRAALERDEAAVDVAGESVRVKRTHRAGGEVTVKAEMDDVANADGGRAGREALRRRAEST